jgi:SAM-dependent methyltransferase
MDTNYMDQAKRVYDRTAINYDLRSGNPYTERVRIREARMISRHVRGRVLDAGCGTGYHLRALDDALGIDVSGEMVKLAGKTGRKVRKADVERLPFRDREFGSAICMYSVLNMVDWRKAIGEICRVAGEKVIVSVASIYDKNYSLSEKSHVRPDRYAKAKRINIEGEKLAMRLFTRGEIEGEFGGNGFVLEEFDSVFRGVAPHWGLWKRLSLGERLGLWMDRFRPAELGCIYVMAFGRGRYDNVRYSLRQ